MHFAWLLTLVLAGRLERLSAEEAGVLVPCRLISFFFSSSMAMISECSASQVPQMERVPIFGGSATFRSASVPSSILVPLHSSIEIHICALGNAAIVTQLFSPE